MKLDNLSWGSFEDENDRGFRQKLFARGRSLSAQNRAKRAKILKKKTWLARGEFFQTPPRAEGFA